MGKRKNIENFQNIQSLQEDLKEIKEVVKSSEVPHVYQEKYKTILSSVDQLLSVEKNIEIKKLETQLEEFQEVTKELIELKEIKKLSNSSKTIAKHLNILKKDNKENSRFKRNRKKLVLGISLITGGVFTSKYLKGTNIDKIKEFFTKLPENIKKFFAGLGTVGTKIKGRRKNLKSKVKTKRREIFHGEEVVNELEKQIEFLKAESTPLKFKILEEKNGHTKVRIKFYDREGNEIKSIDKTIEGRGLNFDFIITPVQIGIKKENGKIEQMPKASLAFPTKIFTNSMKPKDAIKINQEYNKNGFPEIFNEKELSNKSKKTLKGQYKIIQDNQAKPDTRQGQSISATSTNPFKIGTIYKIVSYSKGGLEVTED